MAIEVFNRYENKYLLNEETYQRVTQEISRHMEPDCYNRDGKFYSITNIYYDTEDHVLIRNSLQKPVYKEKLRLRAYQPAGPEDMVFLEVKKKYHGLVNKRRTKMRLRDAEHFLLTGEIPSNLMGINLQVLHELQYLVQHHSFTPAAMISYDRKAYFGCDSDLRVSFDTNLKRTQTPSLLVFHTTRWRIAIKPWILFNGNQNKNSRAFMAGPFAQSRKA